jgi:vacuolar-type H+-ATPase subunit I/STV1
MRRKHRPSLLILRGQARRFPRKLSAIDRTTLHQFTHQIMAIRRDLNLLQRSDQSRRDDYLIGSSLQAQVALVQQAYRDVVATVRGMRAREVPGFDAEDKQQLIKMVNQLAEEQEDVRHLRATIARLTAEVRVDLDALRERMTGIERAVGEESSE